jgi:hypothetical protein
MHSCPQARLLRTALWPWIRSSRWSLGLVSGRGGSADGEPKPDRRRRRVSARHRGLASRGRHRCHLVSRSDRTVLRWVRRRRRVLRALRFPDHQIARTRGDRHRHHLVVSLLGPASATVVARFVRGRSGHRHRLASNAVSDRATPTGYRRTCRRWVRHQHRLRRPARRLLRITAGAHTVSPVALLVAGRRRAVLPVLAVDAAIAVWSR